jgi:histidinol-phosphate aminotransferase
MNVCESVLSLKPYQGGKPISELQRELGLERVVKLASNENPIGPGPKAMQAIAEAIDEVGRYPDGNGFELKKSIGEHLGIDYESITLGNGSNELLELIARLYLCNPDDEVIFSQYSFIVYSLVSQALGAKSVVTPAINFGHDLKSMLSSITKKTKLIYIANPNNPTGTLLSDDEIHDFLSKVPSSVVVVLDQAYFEYLDIDDNAVGWLDEFSNLIITRTFSKAYGLAGLRVGYSLSSIEIADYINRVRQPFNVSHIAQSAATAALTDDAFMVRSILANNNGLLQLSHGFDRMGLTYIPSFANFIALKVDNASSVYKLLLERGFIVRPIEVKGYLRVSVGTKNENDDFLDVLESVLGLEK